MKDLDHFEEVESDWQKLRSEIESIATEYRDEGWKPLQLPVGNVSAVADDTDTFGIHLVVPDNKFDELRELLEAGATFGSFEIYERETDKRVYAIVVAKDEGDGVAILYPLYYSKADRAQLVHVAERRGAMVTHLKTLGEDRVIIEQVPDEFFST